MKLYTLVCNYWNAGDWHNYRENNMSMNPTHTEILAIFTDKETAVLAIRSLSRSEDFTLDMEIYESDDLDTTIEKVEIMSHDERIKEFGYFSLLYDPVENLTIEQESKKLQGDEIIVEWEYYRYVGYARKFHDIYTARELGFERETDLATGNEETPWRINFSVLLDHEEVSDLTEEELEEKIFETLEDGSWKWTDDSYYKWVVNMKFGTKEIEED